MDFSQALILLVVAIVGIITITVSIRFDFTKYLIDRRDRQKDKLKVVCPHTELIELAEGTYVQPLFSQVPGTATYQCSICGYSTHDLDAIQALSKAFEQNRQLYTRRQRQVNRLTKKLYDVKAFPNI